MCLRSAACYLQTSKLGRSAYQDVVHQCDQALAINPASIKAFYRKGVALFHIQRYSEAIDVLTQASHLPDPLHASLGMHVGCAPCDCTLYRPNLKSVALPVVEIIAGTLKAVAILRIRRSRSSKVVDLVPVESAYVTSY